MPSKRKLSSVASNALPAQTTPPAPLKPGKLKSILKRPSPSSRLVASTPSAQIKLEFQAAARTANNGQASNVANASLSTVPPPTAEKLKREIKSVDVPHPNAPRPSLSTHVEVDAIEDSAAETESPKPLRKKINSPRYEDDGDTEDLITDSQPQSLHSDDTLLMSGGLGEGESPYKRIANSTKASPSKRKSKKKRTKKSLKVQEQVGSGPKDGGTLVKEQVQVPILPATKLDTIKENGITADGTMCGTVSDLVKSGAEPKLEPGTTALPLDARVVTATSAVDLNIATSSMSQSPRRTVKQGQSIDLAEVFEKLGEYERTREMERQTLREALRVAEAKATQLKTKPSEALQLAEAKIVQLATTSQNLEVKAAQLHTQLEMLRGELESQSKRRHLQYSWHLNKFAIWSRRTYSLQKEEEMQVIAGCDDLEHANEFVSNMFQGEMRKLESVVEDLGEAASFSDIMTRMPKVQMRLTPCGMTKCRAYFTDSRWDLTVERVAGH